MRVDLVKGEILESWQQFSDIAIQFDVGSPDKIPFVFRGQAKAGEPLFPTLVRQVKEFNPNAEQVLRLEQTTTREFQRQALMHLPTNAIPDREDLVGWWTFMQHYNAPTRLLDWTGSPFVAAYFAAEKHFDGPGEIWAVFAFKVMDSLRKRGLPERPRIHSEARDLLLNSKAPPTIYFMVPDIQTDRMGAQQTAFSFSPQVLADHGEIIVDALGRGTTSKMCRRLIITNDLKLEFLRQLRRMNITARSLFPGIDGSGRSVTELVRITIQHKYKGRDRYTS